MPSTINGNTGTTSGSYLIYAQQIDARGALIGTPLQVAVTSNTGAYSITGLVAGTYRLTVVPAVPNPSGAAQPNNQAPVLNQPVITVDGSSTYAV